MKVVLNLLCCLFAFDSDSLRSPLSEDSDFLLSGEGSELNDEPFSRGESATSFWVISSDTSAGEFCIATGIVSSTFQNCCDEKLLLCATDEMLRVVV